MRPEPGYSWTDLDGDSGFVSADVADLDEAEKEAGIVAVVSIRNGKQESGVYITAEEALTLSKWLAALATACSTERLS